MFITARSAAFSIALGCGAAASLAVAQPSVGPSTRSAPPSGQATASDRRPPPTLPEGIPSLAAAQREQLAALRRKIRNQLAPQREQLRAKRLELRALWLSEPPSEPAILKKLAEIDAIRAAMRPVLVKGQLAHLALLTREQRLALSRPKRPDECPCCPGRMRRMHPHEAATPPADGVSPWLDAGDDFRLEGDGPLELDRMPCGPDSATPPAERP